MILVRSSEPAQRARVSGVVGPALAYSGRVKTGPTGQPLACNLAYQGPVTEARAAPARPRPVKPPVCAEPGPSIVHAPPASAFETRPGADRRLEAALRALEGFGVDLEQLEPAARPQLVGALSELLAVSAGLEALPEGREIHIETFASATERRVAITLVTPKLDLHVEATLDAEGTARYELAFQSPEHRLLTNRTVEIALVPSDDGVLVVPRRLEDPGVPARAASAEAPEPSGEGLDAFLKGALLGDFAGDDSWSALAGQMAIGFVPVAGQVADVGDLLAAADELRAGRPGAPVALGAAILGFVPGLDFLKSGNRLARRALAQAAELGPIAQDGLSRLSKVMSETTHVRLVKEVKVLSAARLELAARLRHRLERAGLGQELSTNVRKAANGLERSHSAEDLVGAVRDRYGIPVPKAEGVDFNHEKEIRDVIGSLRKVEESMKKEIRRSLERGESPGELSKLLEAVREYEARVERLVEPTP